MRINLSAKYQPQVVIIANGTLEDSTRINNLIEDVPHILLCDGALNNYVHRYQRQPDAVIGDGDSVCLEDINKFGIELIKIPDQETNDLTKAVHFALEHEWNEICILGGSGRREDHTIGNIALLSEYYKWGAQVRMITEHGIMIPFQGVLKVDVTPYQQLSLFALSKTPMSAKGVAYPFDNRIFNALWEATLNYATEELIEVRCDNVALIYIANEIRNMICK